MGLAFVALIWLLIAVLADCAWFGSLVVFARCAARPGYREP